jgi:hypothetical protein
LKEINREDIKE